MSVGIGRQFPWIRSPLAVVLGFRSLEVAHCGVSSRGSCLCAGGCRDSQVAFIFAAAELGRNSLSLCEVEFVKKSRL